MMKLKTKITDCCCVCRWQLLKNRTSPFRLRRKFPAHRSEKICGCGNAGVLTSKLQMEESNIQAVGLEGVDEEDEILPTRLEIISNVLKKHDKDLVKNALEPWFGMKRKRRSADGHAVVKGGFTTATETALKDRYRSYYGYVDIIMFSLFKHTMTLKTMIPALEATSFKKRFGDFTSSYPPLLLFVCFY